MFSKDSLRKVVFPETFTVARDYERHSEKFKTGDVLERYYGYTYGCLGRNEEAYRKKGTDGPFTGFTLEAIKEATTNEVPAVPA